MQKLYKIKYSIIICGDVNVNYLKDNNRRSQLDAVLHSYNLSGIVEFPTRFGLISQTAIDNVFIDTTTIGNYEIHPSINGLSDHDAKLLTLSNGGKKEKDCNTTIKRKINKFTIADFQWKLSHETWEQVFHGNDVNMIFNSFLNTFLRTYFSSFPLNQEKKKNRMTQNSWITSGIITSCRRGRELHNKLQNNNNATLASYYENYSKILTKVIQAAKRMEYDKLILNSGDKAKTTWDIINKESITKKDKHNIKQTKYRPKLNLVLSYLYGGELTA